MTEMGQNVKRRLTAGSGMVLSHFPGQGVLSVCGFNVPVVRIRHRNPCRLALTLDLKLALQLLHVSPVEFFQFLEDFAFF